MQVLFWFLMFAFGTAIIGLTAAMVIRFGMHTIVELEKRLNSERK